MSGNRRLRCAIYTRTSSDENLDQEFNSLHAQREACEAYIQSQSGEGWQLLLDQYEDGGISGGSMDRPALQQLLAKVRENRIDVVVVYKIDRLTRSLMDFARIVESFDTRNVSFVSVTQAFNTTNSMGRLTLNVLLSFAQFEREVTAERIRDKIAASKKKGMWMGGNVPLGYRVENRKLLIEYSEAETIRFIFHRYLELRSIRKLADELNASHLTTRRGKPRSGVDYITAPFRSGNLRHILANPIYIGKIRHRDQLYEGEHNGIIEQSLFDQTQLQLKQQAPKRRHTSNTKDTHLLTGLLFDETGDRLTPTHTRNHGRRYRYYVSKRIVENGRDPKDPYAGWRLRADQLEQIVERQLMDVLRDRSQLMELFDNNLDAHQVSQLVAAADAKEKEWLVKTSEEKRIDLHQLFRRITTRPGWIRFEMYPNYLLAWLIDKASDTDENQATIVIEQALSLRRRGVESRLVLSNGAPIPNPDPALIDFIVRANRYLAALTDGSSRTLTQIAVDHGTNISEVSRLLPYAFLHPVSSSPYLQAPSQSNLARFACHGSDNCR